MQPGNILGTIISPVSLPRLLAGPCDTPIPIFVYFNNRPRPSLIFVIYSTTHIQKNKIKKNRANADPFNRTGTLAKKSACIIQFKMLNRAFCSIHKNSRIQKQKICKGLNRNKWVYRLVSQKTRHAEDIKKAVRDPVVSYQMGQGGV